MAAAVATAVPAAAAAGPGLPSDRPGRGMGSGGLRTAAPHGPCDPGAQGGEALLEIHTPAGRVVGCTHGPDPAPAAVRLDRPVSSVALARTSQATAATPTAAPCIGDGISGPRVQAIYAFPADRTSRYGEVEPLIQGWAGRVDELVDASAAETGGVRRMRFVTDAGCRVIVDQVRLSAGGDDTFANTIGELRALGYTRPDRKYLVWMDGAVPAPYCGIAQMYPDDAPSPDNSNNGNPAVPGMFVRVDAPCWGNAAFPVELHELMHSLGAVQASSPHATSAYPPPAGGHCTDEYDVLCYDDDGAGPATTTVACPGGPEERRLDCGHDDYFHTDPPPGSYLDTHWNVADSGFLESEALPADACPPDAGVAVSLATSRRVVPRGAKVALRVQGASCAPLLDDTAVLRMGGPMRVRGFDEGNRAVFRVQVERRTVFRAFAYDQDGVLTGASNRIRVRVRRR
jgi:hypothetical protein